MPNWEKVFDAFGTTAGEVIAVPCPGRCTIVAVTVVELGGGDVTTNFYSRAFTSAPMSLGLITQDPSTGKCLVTMPLSFPVSPGDIVAITNSTVSGYNTNHRVVVYNNDDKSFVTDQTFTANAGSVTATLAIPAGEQPLYQVCAPLTGTGSATATPGAQYVNQDPQTNLTNRGYPQFIYMKFTSAGNFRIGIIVQQQNF